MGAHEASGNLAWLPVRCIVCRRIKQPVGRPIAPDLQAMRCDDRCPGYTLDPPPGDDLPIFHRYAPVAIGTQQTLDLIGRALCDLHFGV